ncbi:beta-propeller fold lactonase family protein [Actinophytocola sp.]|uniref:beta-propeller fold lactonase family protein n=1 Tax=Actinophytocola sp. TaxID=1872138 RepID=UPI0039C897E1
MGDVAGLGSQEGGGIDVFRVNMADGSLELVSSTGPEVADLNSDGICASSDGRFVYCVNRTPALGWIPGTGGGVSAFAINRDDGSLRHRSRLPRCRLRPHGALGHRVGQRATSTSMASTPPRASSGWARGSSFTARTGPSKTRTPLPSSRSTKVRGF